MQPEPAVSNDPAVECVPSAQSTHKLDALLSWSFVPAAHCVHEVAVTPE